MVQGIYNTTTYNQAYQAYNPNFARKKILSKPIEKVQDTIESGIEPFTDPNESEAKKKRRRKAIFASSTVLVLGAATLMLNPRSSGKITSKLKSLSTKMKGKMLKSKDSFLKSKFYEFCHKGFEFGEKGMNMVFNFNSGKDLAFQQMCLNHNKRYPKFITKHERLNNIVRSIDDGFVKVFEKPHKVITEWFDNISKATVKRKYRSLNKNIDAFETLFKNNKDKFSTEEWTKIEDLLKQISDVKVDFSEEKLLSRLKNQEDLMKGLDEKLWNKIYNKKDGFAKNSTEFWVNDLLKDSKLNVENAGNARISKLFGDKDGKGLYDEVIAIAKKNLSPEEFNKFDNSYKNVYQRLVKANDSECIKYFDKKRDLMVGSAPTDILTQLLGLGLCSWAIAKSDKETRLQTLVTAGLPITVGLGSSLVFSALLFPAGLSLLAGAGVSAVTSGVCHFLKKYVFGQDDEEIQSEQNGQNMGNNQLNSKNPFAQNLNLMEVNNA